MTFSIHGLAVARGVAIGRAVLIASSRVDVAHYFIDPEQVADEIDRMRRGRDMVVDEIQKLLSDMPKDAPHELAGLLDVHLQLLQDETLADGVKHWIRDRLYNAEWALTSQLEVIARQFDEMEDEYLRERKADLEQVVERILRHMKGQVLPIAPRRKHKAHGGWIEGDEVADVPLVLIAHDLSPADMLQFKQSVFTGFVTDVGGKTSHTAIVARSLDIPAVVGARSTSHLVHQDDWVIIDGDAGVVIVDPSPTILADYEFKQRQGRLERERLVRLRHTPSVTLDGIKVNLLANIEMPDDAADALKTGAVGVGLFRSEFLFMGRDGQLPDEEEQYQAYRKAVEGMEGLPVTIRTVDIGADKPLDSRRDSSNDDSHLNPALGLRAIRWSLADPSMFLNQLRAILRAAAHGKVSMLIPMLAHQSEIRETLALIAKAREQLDKRGAVYGPVTLGAMIEIPAAALMLPTFLKYFDHLSVGTNDLIQYTLAIDRADETVAHLYDPYHPAVLRLVADTIAQANAMGKGVSICGEMAGDTSFTRLLLGLGLRDFSMHPSRILAIKQQVLRTDTARLKEWAQQVIASDEPALMLADK